MDEIGSILREAREMKGMSIAEAYEKLRINPSYLSALEAGQYEKLPSHTHVRGYLGKYARFLGLDPDPLLERYETVRHQRPAVAPPPPATKSTTIANLPPLPEPETGTFFTHINDEVGTSQVNDSPWINRLVIIALVVAIALISWRFFFSAPNNPFSTESISEAVRTELSASEGEATDGTSGIGGADADNVLTLDEPGTLITSTQRITPTTRTGGSTFVVDGAATPVATRSPLPSTLETIDLQLDVTERTWMRVTVDDITVYEGQARRGDTFNWTAQDSVALRSGNGAGLYVTINGVELGRLGERGQIVDERWQTTQ
ncbi:MAG: helix-turn-helix domain-containing protein [Anaerolineales bacterium]|nr:helix-turn-helix domain-containing protein [Anaerolineales bacterium]